MCVGGADNVSSLCFSQNGRDAHRVLKFVMMFVAAIVTQAGAPFVTVGTGRGALEAGGGFNEDGGGIDDGGGGMDDDTKRASPPIRPTLVVMIVVDLEQG